MIGRIKMNLVAAMVMVAMVTASALPALAQTAAAQATLGCPGQLNAEQAQAGQRAELVAGVRDAANAAGLNFGDVQSGFNQSFCGDGQQP